MNFSDLEEQPLALLLTDAVDGSVHVVGGIVTRKEEGHILRCVEGEIPLQQEWSGRVQEVTGEVLHIVNARYLLRLNVGPLPQNAAPNSFVKTGLRLA